MIIQDKLHVLCPCGSGFLYHQCCCLYHHGQSAPTAEKLMRSRYSAYVLGLTEYILGSWHPDFRPKLHDMGGTACHWIHLDILNHSLGQPDDKHGEVTFAAFYVDGGKGNMLKETSRFAQQSGRWLYLDGHCTVVAISQNALCPCGSTKKFKRCCANLS